MGELLASPKVVRRIWIEELTMSSNVLATTGAQISTVQ
jgi:hypothetical protein